jgi:23S rRNA pseudouridine1911/1915/1917 synthase
MPQRSFVVSREESGQTVAALLRAHLALSLRGVRRLVRDGRILLNGGLCRDAGRRLAPGQRLEVRGPAPHRPPPRAMPAGPVIRHADAQVVVVDKPPGLTTVRHADEAAEFGARAQRYLPPTLADLLPELLGGRQSRVRAVHRLDKETSGLVVFARTPEAERHLGRQFRAHTIERRYLALVRGRAAGGTIESALVRDRGDGRRGSTPQPGAGQRALTHVRVVEELGEYTLVECRLETGRTHQVRIHLGEAGTPLCGDHVYDRPPHGRPLPDNSGAARVALHAAWLGFEHPKTGKPMAWTAPLPGDMAELVERFRRQRRRG